MTIGPTVGQFIVVDIVITTLFLREGKLDCCDVILTDYLELSYCIGNIPQYQAVVTC